LQGPLCRFGDTAANAGVLSLLNELDATRNLPVGIKTACASATAGAWRMLLLPLDATKTMMQVRLQDHGCIDDAYLFCYRYVSFRTAALLDSLSSGQLYSRACGWTAGVTAQ
jgi:hypothetical protein